MKGGHNAKPKDVHILEGTFRKERHDIKKVPGGGDSLRKPDDLKDHASWLWDEATRYRAAWIASSDASALREMCDAYHYAQECKEILNVEPNDKNTRCNYESYMRIYKGFADAFGLTPASRARLGESQEESNEANVMEGLLG